MRRIVTVVLTLATLTAGSIALAENANRGVPAQTPTQVTNCMNPCAGYGWHHQGLTNLEKNSP